jgi:hypothetical protein
VAEVTQRFKPVVPTDEQAMEMIGLQALNSPKQVLSHETVLRDFFQVDDPLAEMDKIAVETEMATNQLLHQMMSDAALKKAGIQPPVPPPPPGLLGPDGLPIAAPPGAPGAPPMAPNGQTAGGMASIPGGTMPLRPTPGPMPPIVPGGQLPHGGGVAAGAYPGRPGNQR